MENEALSKLIPVTVLFLLGIFESLGGLYFNDRRTKNDFSIELLSPSLQRFKLVNKVPVKKRII